MQAAIDALQAEAEAPKAALPEPKPEPALQQVQARVEELQKMAVATAASHRQQVLHPGSAC